jgi:hypothetical protein
MKVIPETRRAHQIWYLCLQLKVIPETRRPHQIW